MTGEPHNSASRADAPPSAAAGDLDPSAAPAAAPIPVGNPLVWDRVVGHVQTLLSKPLLFDDDQVRLKHMRWFLVAVGTAIDKQEPIQRDDLERLAACAIHWALDLPEPDPEDQP